jgi:hypothetical protein
MSGSQGSLYSVLVFQKLSYIQNTLVETSIATIPEEYLYRSARNMIKSADAECGIWYFYNYCRIDSHCKIDPALQISDHVFDFFDLSEYSEDQRRSNVGKREWSVNDLRFQVFSKIR